MYCLDEDNTETSLPPLPTFSNSHSLPKDELIPIAKRQRHLGPFVSSTSEEESDANAIVALPEGIEEQYGFKINPVSVYSAMVTTAFTHVHILYSLLLVDLSESIAMVKKKKSQPNKSQQ